jgi:hypothetical protein
LVNASLCRPFSIPNPRPRMQFGQGAILQHSANPTLKFVHEDQHEHEDDFEAANLPRLAPGKFGFSQRILKESRLFCFCTMS